MTQLVKYDVHTTRKIKPIHAIFLSHIIIVSTLLDEALHYSVCVGLLIFEHVVSKTSG